MNLNTNNPITANGDYDIIVKPGKALLFTLKHTFGGATVTMHVKSDIVADAFDGVAGGSWTGHTEQTLIPSGSIVRLTVTNASGTTKIRANFVPIS
jgi:hypothetical protein